MGKGKAAAAGDSGKRGENAVWAFWPEYGTMDTARSVKKSLKKRLCLENLPEGKLTVLVLLPQTDRHSPGFYITVRLAAVFWKYVLLLSRDRHSPEVYPKMTLPAYGIGTPAKKGAGILRHLPCFMQSDRKNGIERV